MNGFRRGTREQMALKHDKEPAETIHPAHSAIGYDGGHPGSPDYGTPMSIYDDDQEREGPVVVRRPVYDAGMRLERETSAGDAPAFETARDKAAEFRAAGKADDAVFWNEVFQFLMERESVGGETETVILEEGESYDWNEGEVIRSGTDRPRIRKDP